MGLVAVTVNDQELPTANAWRNSDPNVVCYAQPLICAVVPTKVLRDLCRISCANYDSQAINLPNSILILEHVHL